MKNTIHDNIIIDGYKLINFINLSDFEKELVRKWRNHKDIRNWMYNEHEISIQEHNNFITSLKETKNKLYWLVKKNDDDYLGVLNLVNIKWNHRNAYLGIYANPEQKRPGSGETLLSILLKVTFSILKFHTLKLEVLEDNAPAIRLYQKFGFEEEGRLKEFVFKDNKWKDVIIMGKINNV
ncbi:UDP-4-amino-4,6-dideoxy-N-acetyl-beta-L-altrosamine N-acetyltransferase [Deferribacter abyssi]|uniref:UDP-4-amino-4, 6-dideoxy-N-acetyl-beta-L-altrosamine N-acetyltransferase n=1 Tax=Deferribacter abyssi TaxID=213806 RepID=UPI003C166586